MPIEYKINRNRIHTSGSLEFLARQVVEGFITGLHKSPFHGFSVEFAEHRLYNSGEPIKDIDWKVYARTEKLFVKRFEEETNLRCQIVIDQSSSMFFPHIEKLSIDNPNKMTFSIYAAASLIELLKKQRDAIGLTLFDQNINLHTKVRSNTAHINYLFDELEKQLAPIQKDEQRITSAASAIHEIADKIHKRSLVIIFSDMFDNQSDIEPLFDALKHLRHNKHEVVLFHVIDKNKEIDFDFQNRPHRFIDMETGEKIKVNPTEIKEKYIELSRAYKDKLKLRCGQYRIDFVEADINQSLEQILLPYLIKRKKMQ